MSDETPKPNDKPEPGKPTSGEQHVVPGKGAASDGSAQDVVAGPSRPATDKPTTAADQGLKPTTAGDAAKAGGKPPEKPAAQVPGKHGEAKPAAEAKMESTAWDSEMVAKLRGHYGSGIREAGTYRGQNFVVAERTIVYGVLQALHDDEQFDYCVDITALHYPQREEQFEVVWILYSFPRNERVRVKTSIKEGESAPSVVPLWSTANWLERECYDMFGVRFEGHPDLRRILLPDDWKGHPLRKDYGIIQQDQEWVQINLGIESGQ
jgi:NADH-quinone oxidoreductase subunit C